MKIGYKLQTGTSMAIYLRTSLGASWKLVKTIDNATYVTKKGLTVFAPNITSISLGNFYELQMKVVLNGSTYFTPSFLRATVWMEVVNNK